MRGESNLKYYKSCSGTKSRWIKKFYSRNQSTKMMLSHKYLWLNRIWSFTRYNKEVNYIKRYARNCITITIYCIKKL